MNKLATIAFVLLSITFSTSQQQSEKTIENIVTVQPETFEEVIVDKKEYTLKISIENTDNKNPILVIEMLLKNGAHFISPLEKKDYTGKFHFDFGSYKDLEFEGEVSESPRSVAKVLYPNYTSKREGTLWITENTIYKQALNLKTTNDFEVFGRVQFTIEPTCTFEETPFAISYKDGKFTFVDPKC